MTSVLSIVLVSRLRWRLLVLASSLAAAVFGLFAPYAQMKFAGGLLNGNASIHWILTAFLTTVAAHGASLLATWLAVRESLLAQKVLGKMSYSRLIEGPGGFLGRRPVGEGVSIFAVDIPGSAALLDQALLMAGSMVFPLILAPITLFYLFEIPLALSLGVLGLLLLVNLILGYRQSHFFTQFKQLAAERTGLVAEWIQNIRALRILDWTPIMESRIFETRRRETENRIRMVTNGQFMNSVATSSTYLLNIFAVFYLVKVREAQGHSPRPEELISLLWILGVFLARPLRQFPWAFVMTLDAFTSMGRLQRALDENIRQPRVLDATEGSTPLMLDVEGLSLEEGGQMLLKDIDLKVPEGSLVAIVGEVGAGKSLLLQSLAGATGASFRKFGVHGRLTEGPSESFVRDHMAYIPQQGFTMSASLRENVEFTYHERESELELGGGVNLSLQTSQFDPVTEGLGGLEAEIGERGVNLSGGQRQRVSMARAHYARRAIMLLDDCLSAVDVRTEDELLKKLIFGDWVTKTRILATHRLGILPRTDEVIFLKSGRVMARGSYQRLLEEVPEFREFIERDRSA